MKNQIFFNAHQRATVQAAMARIIPSDETPGATEAGTIDFVDRYLSGTDYIYAKPDGSGFEKLTGKRRDAWQQRIDIVRDCYTNGIQRLDAAAKQQYTTPFVDLSPDEQDALLRQLTPAENAGEVSSDADRQTLYGAPAEPALQQTNAETELDFVGLLVLHTRQGFYADPIYGGNRNRIGWQVIGFPGPLSLADVHNGSYCTLEYFAENKTHCCEAQRS